MGKYLNLHIEKAYLFPGKLSTVRPFLVKQLYSMNKKNSAKPLAKQPNYFQGKESQVCIILFNTKMQSKTINGGVFLRNLRKETTGLYLDELFFQVLRLY